jgi:hypothetical protein
MVAGLIRDVPTVKELIDRIMAEAESLVRSRLAGFAFGAADPRHVGPSGAKRSPFLSALSSSSVSKGDLSLHEPWSRRVFVGFVRFVADICRPARRCVRAGPAGPSPPPE